MKPPGYDMADLDYRILYTTFLLLLRSTFVFALHGLSGYCRLHYSSLLLSEHLNIQYILAANYKTLDHSGYPLPPNPDPL